MLHDIEFIIGGKDKKIESLRDKNTETVQEYKKQVSELNDRLEFFTQNQKLLSEGENENRSNF